MCLVVSQKNISTISFILDRLTRIVPLYWLLTLCIYIITIIKPEYLKTTTNNFIFLIKSLLFIPFYKNIHQLQPLLGQGWTLNYEIYFYLAITLGLLIASKKAMLFSALLIILLFVTSFLFTNQVLFTFFNNSIAIEFIYGILIYKLYIKKYLLFNSKPLIFILLILLMYFLMALIESNYGTPSRIFLFGIPSAIIFILFINLEIYFSNSNSKYIILFIKLGNSSYSLYLIHPFVIYFLTRIIYPLLKVNNTNLFYVFFSLLITTYLGILTYRYLDYPLHRYFKNKLVNL